MIYHFYRKEWKVEKVKKFVTNLRDKIEYVIYIRYLKQALNHELILKKVHSVIKFNQNAWLKPYIHMNTKFRQKAKNNFERNFFYMMNNAVFGEAMESAICKKKIFHRKFISNRN